MHPVQPGWASGQPGPQAGPAWGQGGNSPGSYGGGPVWPNTRAGSGWGGGPAQGQASFARRNQASLIAMGVAVAYILLEVTAHVFILGIVPVMMSVRAFQRKESLAPAAVAAAILAVAVALITR